MLHGGRGVGGWLGDENDFAMEMNVAVPFAFFLYQGTKGQGTKLLYLLLLGIFVLSSIATASRRRFSRPVGCRDLLLVIFTTENISLSVWWGYCFWYWWLLRRNTGIE